MDERFADFLRELAPYVVVVGSFGRGEEHDGSDIDCYLRARPRELVDPEAEDNNETYMPEVMALIRRYDFIADSVVAGHIAVERQPGVPRMVEVSEHYHIRVGEQIHVREIYGIPFLCARDDKDTPLEERYEYMDWSDEAGDVVIRNPLPNYNEAVGLTRAGKKMGRPKAVNPKSVGLSIRLDADTAEAMEGYCHRNGVSKGEAIRRGIRRLVEEEDDAGA